MIGFRPHPASAVTVQPVPVARSRRTHSGEQFYDATSVHAGLRFDTSVSGSSFIDPARPHSFVVGTGVRSVRLALSGQIVASEPTSIDIAIVRNGVAGADGLGVISVSATASDLDPHFSLTTPAIAVEPGDVLSAVYRSSAPFSLANAPSFSIEVADIVGTSFVLSALSDVVETDPADRDTLIYDAPARVWRLGKPVVVVDEARPVTAPHQGALVYANGTLPHVRTGAVELAEVAYDTGPFFSAGRSSSLDIPGGVGKVRVSAAVHPAGATCTEPMALSVVVNSVSVARAAAMPMADGSSGLTITSPIIAVDEGDRIEVRFDHGQPETVDVLMDPAVSWVCVEVVETRTVL